MIRFTLNCELHEATDLSPTTTLLDYIRDHLRLTGTKEGCAEGDCGACTIVRVRDGKFEAVNSCLMQIAQADGQEILTIEGLGKINNDALIPVQEAMASGDGTQCGFCTPGIVGALFALGQSGEVISDPVIHDALAGNLCRCTGYRPIVDAARQACDRAVSYTPAPPLEIDAEHAHGEQIFHTPSSIAALISLRTKYPEAMLLAGGTDLGLMISKGRHRPKTVIHTAHVVELGEISETADVIYLGAAVTYTEALPLLEENFPSFAELIRRIGSRQIRNLGTMGGNIGNASPIGDTPPCLIALNATLILASSAGEREISLEEFFLDYRKTDLQTGEIIKGIRIPKLSGEQVFRAYKVSKRYDQDISAVIGAFRVTFAGDIISEARIAFGGMAATPKRAIAAEAALAGRYWSEEIAIATGQMITNEFSPIDDHRASAAYRSRVASNLFTRLFRDLSSDEQVQQVVAL